jgi:hypothetical protein
MKKKPMKSTKPKKLSKTAIRGNFEDLVEDMFLNASFGVGMPTIADLQNVVQGMGSNDAYWLRIAKRYEPETAKAMAAQAKKPAKKRT